jgi:hypothetical protein
LTRALAATLALACFLLLPAGARADGDPASDYLLVRDVFLHFQVTIEATDATAVVRRLASATGYPLPASTADRNRSQGRDPIAVAGAGAAVALVLVGYAWLLVRRRRRRSE